MSDDTSRHSVQRLDVRPMRKRDRHPAVFAAYDALEPGGSFVLFDDHDPEHLREEFEIEHPGSYRWDYLARRDSDWRIRIGKASGTPLPREVVNTHNAADQATTTGPRVLWKLQVRERDLDSNIIALAAGETIDAHCGPKIDVLIHVLAGTGRLTTELGDIELSPGALIFLPRNSRRQFTAHQDGLRYLTVHQRRDALVIHSHPSR